MTAVSTLAPAESTPEFDRTLRFQRITPRARRAATERSIEIAQLRGSGPNARIIERDVLEFVAPLPAAQATPKEFISETSISETSVLCLRAHADATRLLEMRDRFGPYAQKQGVPFSLTDMLLQTLAVALRLTPRAAIGQNTAAAQVPQAVFGLAQTRPDGSETIAAWRGQERPNLLQIAQWRAQLEAAPAGEAEAASGASVLHFQEAGRADMVEASLAAGWSSALGIGRIAPRPFVTEGALCVRSTLHLCLRADARVLDCGSAAQLLERIVEFIEEPELLVFS